LLLTNRIARILIGAILVTTVLGCAASAPEEPVSVSAVERQAENLQMGIHEPAATPLPNTVGVWEGTTVASCGMSLPNRCDAEELVTITLLQGEGSKLTGYYKCSYGNRDCYNMNETGKVMTASQNGSLLSIMVTMPDASTCRFNGRIENGAVNGGYTCYNGAALLEQGSWRARRSY